MSWRSPERKSTSVSRSRAVSPSSALPSAPRSTARTSAAQQFGDALGDVQVGREVAHLGHDDATLWSCAQDRRHQPEQATDVVSGNQDLARDAPMSCRCDRRLGTAIPSTPTRSSHARGSFPFVLGHLLESRDGGLGQGAPWSCRPGRSSSRRSGSDRETSRADPSVQRGACVSVEIVWKSRAHRRFLTPRARGRIVARWSRRDMRCRHRRCRVGKPISRAAISE